MGHFCVLINIHIDISRWLSKRILPIWGIGWMAGSVYLAGKEVKILFMLFFMLPKLKRKKVSTSQRELCSGAKKERIYFQRDFRSTSGWWEEEDGVSGFWHLQFPLHPDREQLLPTMEGLQWLKVKEVNWWRIVLILDIRVSLLFQFFSPHHPPWVLLCVSIALREWI